MALVPSFLRRKALVTLAAPPAKRRADTRELGAPGNIIAGGVLTSQDYNLDLRYPYAYDIYDRMRKSDGQVRAALNVIKLPLLTATWEVEEASDSPDDVEIAEYLQEKLMNMTITWQSMLRQALLMLDYGSMVFEKVWEVKDGLICLRKLAPRMPRTVTAWEVDEYGGLKGIKQSAQRASTFEVVEIPVEKLLVFVNEQEASDFRGISVLRAAYKHWFFKDKLYIIDAIAKERRAIGVDVGTLTGPDVSETDQGDLEIALMGLHAHEKQFFVETDVMKYRVEGLRGGLADSMGSIEHHDTRILRSVLAEFLAMGEGSNGSLAMHKDKSSFFLMALGALGQSLVDTFNRYLIPQWVDYNWVVKQDQYPKLKHSRLDTRQVGELADAVNKFVTAGTLTVGPDVEEQVRIILDFPRQTDEEIPEPPPEPVPPEQMPSMVFAKAMNVNFSAIERVLDSGEARIVDAVRQHQVRQITKLTELALDALRTNHIEKLESIAVPYRDDLAKDVARVLREIYQQGRDGASQELHLQLDLEPEAIVQFIAVRARAVVNVLSDRLKSNLVWTALGQHRKGEANASEITRGLTQLSDQQIRKIAGNSVSEALNLGRESVASKVPDGKAVYSSVLDRGTCMPCSSADGIEVIVGSPEYEQLRPPYRECFGWDRCRCVFIYIS